MVTGVRGFGALVQNCKNPSDVAISISHPPVGLVSEIKTEMYVKPLSLCGMGRPWMFQPLVKASVFTVMARAKAGFSPSAPVVTS